MAEMRLVNLHKRYGSAAALHGITLTVRQGELLALLGPSGCGKTTTLQIVAGFVAPDVGEVWIGDRLLSSPRGAVPPERRRMSLVFQSYALWPHMTVFQNVAFGLEMDRVPRAELARRVRQMLEIVNLGGYEARFPHELSGGQQQRVALARALVVQPDTLLLDEPLSNLDANLREQMRFEIRRIHQETGITMIYVTHDQAEAMVIADRIAVMNHGVVEQVGTPQEIYTRPRSRFVAGFIGQTNCLPGRLVAPGLVRHGELQFRASGGDEFRAGDEVVLCVRPRAVCIRSRGAAVGAEASDPGSNANTVRGRLTQQAYLGDLQDLHVALPGGIQIRALAPAGEPYEPGQDVIVELPVDACLLVRP
jgi:iron(III) transport system ATP-binding protein